MIEKGNLPAREVVVDAVRQALGGGTSKGTIDDELTGHHLNGVILSILHGDGPLSAPAFARELVAHSAGLPVLYKLELHLGYLHIASLAVHERLGSAGGDHVVALAREDLVNRFAAEDRDVIADLIVGRLSEYARAQRDVEVGPTSAFAESLYLHVTGRPPASSDALRPVFLLYPVLVPAFQKFVDSINR